MRKLLLPLLAAVLLFAQPAWAVIADVGALGTATNINAGHTTTVLTTSATLEVGNCGVLMIAHDDAPASPPSISSTTDSAGNTYVQMAEFPTAAGATSVAVFATRATIQLTSGGTVTINQNNGPDRTAVSFREFTCATALELEGTPQTRGPASEEPGELVISGLESKNRLYLRAISQFTAQTDLLTVTTNFTTIGAPVVADGTADNRLVGEFRVNTSIGETSNPTTGFAAVTSSMFIALEESSAVVTRRPQAPVIFQ